MTVIDDFVAEALRLQGILGLLTQAQWQAESGAGGWSVADVVLHLAQSDEAVAASADGADHRADVAAAGTVDGWAARMVDAERAAPDLVFARWREARDTAVEALREADQDRPLLWVAGPMKPGTLATTRLRSTGRTASTSPSRSASTSPTPTGCGISPGWRTGRCRTRSQKPARRQRRCAAR